MPQILIGSKNVVISWDASTSSEIRKSRKPLTDEDTYSVEKRESAEEHLTVTVDYVSLKDMPLEERRKQAQKPLYLTRYE